MMETKYGVLPNEILVDYKDKITGKIFKILPMKEENCLTWDIYIESLLYELIGCNELVEEFKNNADFLSLLSILKNLSKEDDVKVIRREVFNCLDLIKKL